MSSELDKYRKRLNHDAREGENMDVGRAFENNTNAFMNANFKASPTYRLMKVSGTEYGHIDTIEARVIEVERLGSLREVLFKPRSEGLNVGAYVEFDGDTWLVIDQFGSNKVLVQRCNRPLKWRSKNGEIVEQDAIASATDLGSKSKQSKDELEWNKYDVRLPLGQLFIFTELTDATKEIKLNHRFIFGSKVYEVTGIDDTTTVSRDGYGVVQFTVKIDIIRNGDDFENQIAENDYSTDMGYPDMVDEDDDGIDDGGAIW